MVLALSSWFDCTVTGSPYAASTTAASPKFLRDFCRCLRGALKDVIDTMIERARAALREVRGQRWELRSQSS